MATEELLKELKLRENKLKAKLVDINTELDAISTLIGVYRSNPDDSEIIVRTKYSNKSISSGDIKPKGSANWQDYAYTILSSLNEAKVSDVAELAIKANPDIEPATIRNAISSKLSKLYLAKKIDALVGINKKDGYTYKIKKSQ